MMRTKPPTNSQRMEGSSQLADPGERHNTHQCHALQPAVMCTVLSLLFKLGLPSVTVTKRTAEFESVFDINCNQIGALSLNLCTLSDSCHYYFTSYLKLLFTLFILSTTCYR